MSERALITARDDSLYALEVCLDSVGGEPIRSGEIAFEIAQRYHCLGIVALLLDGDARSFSDCLARSAQVHLHAREQERSGLKLPRNLFCTSLALPYADALAAGEIEAARAIGETCAQEVFPDVEYEDDFLQVHFLQRLLLEPHDSDGLEKILKRWSKVLEGARSAWWNTCRALLDQSNLDDAVQALIDERSARFEEWRQTTKFRPELDATEGSLYVWGLAVLRLAELRGIETRAEFPTLPSLARVGIASAGSAANSWRQLPTHLRQD